MKCDNCGFQPYPGDQVCINCGAKLNVASIQSVDDIEKLSYNPAPQVKKASKKNLFIAIGIVIVIILIAIIIAIFLLKR